MKDGVPLGSRYILHGRLGAGATGVVHEASVIDEDRTVAVKLMREELFRDLDSRRRFVAEAGVLRRVDHPNVVSVLDVVAEGSRLAIVMESAPGSNLRAFLAEAGGTLPPTVACQLAAQVASGLSAVHALKVVHADLKPENVLVDTPSGRLTARIVDFGIAVLLEETASRGPTEGTPGYWAPEVVSGRRPDPAADVYALGVILHELLTGSRPRGQVSGGSRWLRGRYGEGAPLAGPPPELRQLVIACSSSRPGRRPAAAALAPQLYAFASTLEGVPALPPPSAPAPREEGTTHVRPPDSQHGDTTTEGRTRPAQRRRWLLTGVALVALLPMLAWGATQFGGPDDDSDREKIEAGAPPACYQWSPEDEAAAEPGATAPPEAVDADLSPSATQMSRPTAVLRQPGHLTLFARSWDGRGLLQRDWTSTAGWRWPGWVKLGGKLTGEVDAAACPDGSLHVVAHGWNSLQDRADAQRLLWRSFHPTAGWRPWAAMETPTKIAHPATVTVSPGQQGLHLWYVDDKGHLYVRTHVATSGWGPWERLGGNVTSPPNAVARGGQLEVVAWRGDGTVGRNTYDGRRWTGWVPVPVPEALAEGRSLAVTAPDPDSLIVAGSDDLGGMHVGRWSRDGGWVTWEHLGENIGVTNLASGPELLADGTAQLYAFGRTEEGAPFTTGWTAPDGWSEWRPLG
jgi:tRNA A-37 threonylcarbamoyl transferase component Bud32